MSERTITDEEALDKINEILSESTWPYNFLDMILDQLKATGREEIQPQGETNGKAS